MDRPLSRPPPIKKSEALSTKFEIRTKNEIRSTKSETNSNKAKIKYQISKPETKVQNQEPDMACYAAAVPVAKKFEARNSKQARSAKFPKWGESMTLGQTGKYTANTH
jgi:hypothetical protein